MKDDAIALRLAYVRQLMRRLAAPHPGVRLVTEEAEAHVAVLEPQLSVLAPDPFSGLTAAHHGDDSAGQSSVRRSRPRTSSALNPRAEPRRHSESEQRAAPPARSQRVGERLSPAARTSPARAAATSAPVQRATDSRSASSALPEPQVMRERVIEHGVHGVPKAMREPETANAPTRPGSQQEASPVHAAPADNADRVDLEALVQRVLRVRRTRPATGRSARRAQPDELAPASASTPLPVSSLAAEPGVPGSARAPRPVLPISPRATRAAPPAPSAIRGRAVRAAVEHALASALPASAQAPTMPQSAARADGGRFIFDPFEPRDPVDTGAHALADRIDQALREQARRQGVDLT